MARPKKFIECVTLHVSMDKIFHQHLKNQAIEQSRRAGELITVSEMVRRGLEAAFPTSKQEMLSL